MAKDQSKQTYAAHPQAASPAAWLGSSEPEAIGRLKGDIESGREWHRAILEAMALWTLPEEEFQGRHYRYLVEGEAFDWLLLAERLCAELDGMVPPDEMEHLLFYGRLPDPISSGEFRELMGYSKHRAFLNYWYGVVVEEALQLAVEEEVRKQHRARSLPDTEELVEEAFVRIYEDTHTNLVKEFLKQKRNPARKSLSLTEMKEFTYRLFKRRLEIWDPARVASDTRKGLDRLSNLRSSDPFRST